MILTSVRLTWTIVRLRQHATIPMVHTRVSVILDLPEMAIPVLRFVQQDILEMSSLDVLILLNVN